MKTIPSEIDILVIGAGPAGSVAAALLAQQGHSVMILEKSQFPRFSIGESLLPQCMEFLEQANMLEAVTKHGFQIKNGVTFSYRNEQTLIDFAQQYTPGWTYTYQVQRGAFDKILADRAEEIGAPIMYEYEVTAYDNKSDVKKVEYRSKTGDKGIVNVKFVLDASGFGRVLPKLLNLEKPSDFPVRKAIFTHVNDNIADPKYDRNRILACIHPTHQSVWYWLIPFSNNMASVGVVGEPEYIDHIAAQGVEKLKALLAEDATLNHLLKNAEFNFQTGELTGYAANVDSLHGPGFALLGNAGEFLDPIFSSGVTIAMKSASMAANLLDKQLRGQVANWAHDYDTPLRLGISTFKHFVTAWYNGGFQNLVFSPKQSNTIRKMICSILAGYAWDTTNPYVSEKSDRLQVLLELC